MLPAHSEHYGCSFFLHLFLLPISFYVSKLQEWGLLVWNPPIGSLQCHCIRCWYLSSLCILGFKWREHEMNTSSLGVWWWANLLKAYHLFPKWFSKWTTRWGLRQVLDSFLKGVYLHFLFPISCQQVMRVWEISVPRSSYKETKPFPAGKNDVVADRQNLQADSPCFKRCQFGESSEFEIRVNVYIICAFVTRLSSSSSMYVEHLSFFIYRSQQWWLSPDCRIHIREGETETGRQTDRQTDR